MSLFFNGGTECTNPGDSADRVVATVVIVRTVVTVATTVAVANSGDSDDSGGQW